MKKFLTGLALLPFMSTVALAQPLQLNADQMDVVTAGWHTHEIDISNTSWTEVSVWQPLQVNCGNCYLKIQSQALSIQSAFGPTVTPST